MKNFNDFADNFLDHPNIFSESSEKQLLTRLTQYLDPDIAKALIQFQKNYSLLLLEEYHKWFSKSD